MNGIETSNTREPFGDFVGSTSEPTGIMTMNL